MGKNKNDYMKEDFRVYNDVFSSDNGKKVLYDLMDFCFAFQSSAPDPMARNPKSDPYITYVIEGRRQVFNAIRAKLNLTPEYLDNLVKLQEQMNKENDYE